MSEIDYPLAVAEVLLTGVVSLGAVSYRLHFFLMVSRNIAKDPDSMFMQLNGRL